MVHGQSGGTIHRRRAALAAFAVLTVCVSSSSADDLDIGGMVSTDFRAAVDGERQGDLIWNINIGEVTLKQRLNPHIRYELDLRVMFDGLSFADNLHTLDDLTNSLSLDPFWIESDAAAVTIRDIFEGFDIVFGRQIVTWGASDRFRPTNNINPDDLWDPTRFGMTQANEMIRFLYNPVGSLVLEAVYVPIFRPARLPGSAAAALSDPNSAIPILEQDEAARLDRMRRDSADLFDFATHTSFAAPSPSLENFQAGARISWQGWESDWSLSYYYGFDDFPHPTTSVPTITAGQDCSGEPVAVGGCVDTLVGMTYPRVHVFGFDVAGQIPFLDDAGFRLEGAVVWPEEVKFVADIPDAFEPLYGPDVLGTVVDGRPFFKATLGIDYTFARDIFGIAMLVHGMVDELGPQLVGDYAVLGADFRFFNEKLLLRVFAIASIDTEHPAGVIYPLLNWNPWSSMELEAGALVMLGDDKSKFGQPAAGASTVFVRSRVRF